METGRHLPPSMVPLPMLVSARFLHQPAGVAQRGHRKRKAQAYRLADHLAEDFRYDEGDRLNDYRKGSSLCSVERTVGPQC